MKWFFRRDVTPTTDRIPAVITTPRSLEGQIHFDPAERQVIASEQLKGKVHFLQWLDMVRQVPGHRSVTVQYATMSTVTEQLDRAHHTTQTTDAPGDEAEVADRALALLREGASVGASDIHILRRERHTEVQFRINGNLVVAYELDNPYADRLIRAMYRLGSSQAASVTESLFQDGAISGDILKGTGLENVRIVRGPCVPLTLGGQFMILRLQATATLTARRPARPPMTQYRTPSRPAGELKLRESNYSQSQVDRILSIVMAPSGALLCTGPTGSGKTTLLSEIWKEKARCMPGRRLVTIEQPAELIMPWAIQLDIPNTADAEEAARLMAERQRTTLRMDPDDLGLAEIRDVESALTMFSEAQTGHFVGTTLHVDDPFDFPLRLQNMDFTRLSFAMTCNASVIRGVVAQRLLPVLCQCAVPWSSTEGRMARLSRLSCEAVPGWCDDLTHVRQVGPGCAACYGTGYTGRTVVAEVVETDERLMNDFIMLGVSRARHRYRSRPDADPSMLETAMGLVARGIVDPFDVNTRVDRIRPKDVVLEERHLGARD
ncbi:GspE/PulE family protein [Acetobacter vaccinii]|uniref:DNA-binding protein n=1 Tax=Acetobacter vaccinii TaxID=2592655 RepID=A0A5C1YTP9_9PROT|nr:ATPase, T2SS/T4P/T4SS family [Acetobacter vaccinii]QEO18739.1 DNA-binding protein [Acetobacter vaccinii]